MAKISNKEKSLHLLIFLILTINLLGSNLQAMESEEKPPNIIFILADDMGYGDVEAYNRNSKIPTPHLNKLAKGGMVFTDAHTSSSVCTPTRYALLTGRYNWRSRLQASVTWGFSKRLIEDGRSTVANILQSAGYHTSCIGKWHLGMNWPLLTDGIADDGNTWKSKYRQGWAVDFSKPITQGPTSLGFNHFFGISASLDMPPYVYIRNDRPLVTQVVEKAFNRKGPADIDFEAVDVMPRLAYETIRKINKWAPDSTSGKPFFLYVPLAAPHTPIVPSSEWVGRSQLNDYGDFTMQVDQLVGTVYRCLQRNDILEDTLFIFSTDNGCSPAANLKEMEGKGHFANAPWRGHKADIYEGGHRVPFIVHWPRQVAAGSRSDSLICQTDFLSTCAEIAGQAVDSKTGEDSFSFLKIIKGDKEMTHVDFLGKRRAVVHHSINGSFAVRSGNWKLSLCPGSGGWSQPKPGSRESKTLPPVQLYNLKTDPSESKNLHAKYPEKVKELYDILSRYVANGRSTPGPMSENTVVVDFAKGVPDQNWKP